MQENEMLAGAYEDIRTRRLLELKHPDGASLRPANSVYAASRPALRLVG